MLVIKIYTMGNEDRKVLQAVFALLCASLANFAIIVFRNIGIDVKMSK
jgi:hypothetical protein